MSDVFSGLAISASGMRMSRTWLDAISHNIANVNTVRSMDQVAFQEQLVVAGSVGGGDGEVGRGVQVEAITLGDEEGVIVFDPVHPLADEEGLVRLPAIDMSKQFTSMIRAQRTYEANINALERSRDTYLRTMEIGR